MAAATCKFDSGKREACKSWYQNDLSEVFGFVSTHLTDLPFRFAEQSWNVSSDSKVWNQVKYLQS